MNAKLLIVDDHEIVRAGIRMLLAGLRPEWEICGEASSGSEAIEAVKILHPDLVILDISMPGMSGIEVAAKISAMRSGCRILAFTMHESDRLNVELRETGAHGYVLKSQASRDLVQAIDRLLEGSTFFLSKAPGLTS